MATYLLTWNPKRWQWDDLRDVVREIRQRGFFTLDWSCSQSKRLKVNDRVFLIRLGMEPRGIIGSGVVIKAPYEREHWNYEKAKAGKTQMHVDVQFDTLLDPKHDMILPREFLKSQELLSSMHWDSQSSGIKIRDDVAIELEKVWREIAHTDSSFTLPEQVQESEAYYEGATQKVSVNTYERNPEARKRCIEYYGTDCQICGINLGKTYGKVGEDFTHVHHIIPLSEIGAEYEVDPIADLRPVCPNCHAIIHRRKPAYSADEVKEFLVGQVVDPTVKSKYSPSG